MTLLSDPRACLMFSDCSENSISCEHRPVDLHNTIRPQLDEVDIALIAELQERTAIRASASCRVEMAKAVGRYVSAVPRQNLIRSKNSPISLFPVANRLNTVRDGNEEFLRRVARSLRQHLQYKGCIDPTELSQDAQLAQAARS